ncbi:C40 family peptidase [Caballeronia sp. EK]|uniref:C40 family peptidase n=1 Tax=Caballeronia sp. EK TaxID=2767469 RepID=UPI00165519EE|nr:C40 family peptidase [Caballeronia sp. EK]MBC8638263.1 C40 family peptidase [Caballeronia sp. EK]
MNDPLLYVIPHVIIHAQSEMPRECCGVVVVLPRTNNVHYVACNNIRQETEHFIIDPKDYVRAEDTGRVVAIAHSHVYEPPVPSLADLAGIERTGLPWLIVNVPIGSHTITQPSGFKAPLLGRPFVHGVHDCYALVRDAYAEQGIALNDYARRYGWWNDEDGSNLYRENFAAEGFVPVIVHSPTSDDLKLLRPFDLILMNIRARRENHMAIYLGGGVILHHLIGTASRREAYQEFYQRRTTAVLRHRDLMPASETDHADSTPVR